MTFITFALRLRLNSAFDALCETVSFLKPKRIPLAVMLTTWFFAPPVVLTSQAQVVNIIYTDGVNKLSNISVSGGSSVNLQLASGTSTQIGILSETGGTSTWEKTGAGTLVLQGDHTFAGDMTVTGGILDLAGGSIASTAVIVESGAGIQVDGASLLDTAAVTLSGTGNLTLTGDETISSLASASTTSSITLGSNTLTAGDSTNTNFYGNISGTGGFTKTGTGYVSLFGINTYTGTTTLSAGVTDLNNGQAIADTAAIHLNGGYLVISGNETIGALSGTSGGIWVTGPMTFTTNGNAGPTEYSAGLYGDGSTSVFTKGGSDTLTLSGNVGSGGGKFKEINVNSGTLVLSGNDNAMDAINVGGGTLRLEADGAAGGAGGLITTTGSIIDYGDGVNNLTAINVNSNTTQLQVSTGSAEQSGIISETSGPRPLEKIGAGTLVLSAANTYTGHTTVTGGILDVTGSIASTAVTVENGAGLQVDGASLLDSAAVTLNGTSNLQLTGSETIGSLASSSTTSTVSLGTSTLTTGDASNTEFAGVISGSGALNKTGSGTFELSGLNTYTGDTTVTGGILEVTGSIASSLISIASGAGLQVDGASLLDTATVDLDGTANLTLTGDETIGTITNISSGSTISLGTNTLSLAGTGISNVNGIISGTGGLILDNTGYLMLRNANTYTGATTINDGFLYTINGQAIADTAAVIVNGGTLAVNDSETIGALSGTGGRITIFNGQTLTTNGNAGPTEYSGDIAGNGTTVGEFTKGGSDTLTLSGAVGERWTSLGKLNVNSGTLILSNNRNGMAEINVGDATLRLEANNAAGGADRIINTTAGSVIDYGDTIDNVTAINVNSNTTQLRVSTGSAEQSGVIGETTGPRPLEKIGAGTLELSSANTYTGVTTVTGGILDITGSIASTAVTVETGAGLQVDGASLLDSAAVTLNGTGNLNLTGSETIGSLESASATSTMTLGSSTFTTGDANNTEFAGVISGTGALNKTGSGTFELSRLNTYTGDTTVTGGILNVTGSIASSTVSVQTGAELQVYGNSLLDTSALTLIGTGRLTLNGDETIGIIENYSSLSSVSLGVNTLTLMGNESYASSSTIYGSISGTGGLTKSGDNFLGLDGVNTYTGNTTINGGFLYTLNGQAIADTSSLNMTGGGTLVIQDSETIGALSGSGGRIHILENQTLTTNGNAGSTEYAGRIAGSGPPETSMGEFTKGGSDTLTLSGVIDSSLAAVNVNSGTLILSNNSNAMSAINLNGGTLRLEADGAAGGASGLITTTGSVIDYADTVNNLTAIHINSDTTQFQVTTGSAEQSGGISETSGPRPLEKTGAGTLVLSAANTYTGDTTITEGILDVTGSIASALVTVQDGAGLQVDGASLLDTAVLELYGTSILTLTGDETIGAIGGTADTIIALGSHTLTVGNSIYTTAFEGSISGTGGLTNNGPSTMILLGNNTYTGTTTLHNGKFSLAGGQAINDNASVIVNGGIFGVYQTETIGALAGTGGVITIAGGESLITNGSGFATEFSGNINSVATNSVFTKAGSDTLRLSGIIGTGMSEVNVNNGTLILSNNENTMGAVNVAGGTLRLEADGAAGGVAGLITTTGSIIDYANAVNIATAININSNTTQLQVNTGSATQSGVISEISGPRPLEKTGAGTLILSAANTYTGPTIVSGGLLDITTGSITSPAVSVASGAGLNINANSLIHTVDLTLNGNLTTIGDLTFGSLAGSSSTSILALGNHDLNVGSNNGSTLFAGNISGSGALTKRGTGTLSLTGSNTHTGRTTVSAGTLAVTGLGSLASTYLEILSGASFSTDGGALALSSTVVNSGFFDLTGSESIGNLNGSGMLSIHNGSLILNEGSSHLSTVISGTGGLTVQGTSHTSLSAANIYTGETLVNSVGILTITSTGSIVSDTIVTEGGTFINSGSAANVANAGTASNFGTVTSLMNTAGVFDNDGIISGDTTILGGTVNNNVGASISGTTTIGSSGTFNNDGIIRSIISQGRFVNNGRAGAISNWGNFTNRGSVASLINVSGTFNNNGTIGGDTTITGGTVNNLLGASIIGDTFVSPNGTFANAGLAGSVFNSGNSSNTGTILSLTQTAGSFVNSGQIMGDLGIAAGIVTNQVAGIVGGLTIITAPGVLDNAGALADVNNTGTFTNSGTAANIFSSGLFTNTGTVAHVTYAGPSADSQLVAQSLSRSTASLSETVAQTFLNAGVVLGNLFLTSGTSDISAQGSVAGVTVVRSGALLTNAGSLQETLNEGTLDNAGTIGNLFNSGTATNSGTLASLSNTNGTFSQHSGKISGNLIVTGGEVDISGGTVDGVTQNDGGTLHIAGGTFVGDVTNFKGSTNLTGTVQGNFFNGDLMTVSDSGTFTLEGGITNHSGATLDLTGTTVTLSSALENYGITHASGATLHANVTNAGQFELTAATVTGNFDNSGVLILENGTISGSLTNATMVIAHGMTSIGGLISSGNGFITMAGNGTGDVLTIRGAIPNGGVFETDLDLMAGTADRIDAGNAQVSGTVQFVFDREGTGFIGDPIRVFDTGVGSSDFSLFYSNLPIGGLVDYTLETSASGGVDLISQINMGVGAIAANTSLMQAHISTVVNRPISDFLRYQNAKGTTFQTGYARSTFGSATINSTFNNGVSEQTAAFDFSYAGAQAGWDIVYNDARFFNGWNGSIGAMIGYNTGKSDQQVLGTIGNGEFLHASTSHTDFKQNYFTVYGSLSKDPWIWDSQLRLESTRFELTETIQFGSGLGLYGTQMKNQSFSLSNRIGYLLELSRGFAFQPSIGVSFAQTSGADVQFAENQSLQVDSFHSILGFVGGVWSKKFISASQLKTTTLFLEGNYYQDFADDGSAVFTDNTGGNHTITTGKFEGFGELGMGVSFLSIRANPNARIKSINGVLRADAQFGDQFEEAINFSGQIRLTF